MVLEKLPPHDIAAEEAVIASIMVDDEAIYKIASLVRPEDFFREKNAWVYDACLALWARNEPANSVMLAHELGVRGQLEAIGGPAYLSQLTTDLPTSVGVEYYARIVARDGIYRRLISAAGRIAQMAYEGGPDLDGVISKAESLLMTLRAGGETGEFRHIRDLLDQFIQDVGQEEDATDSIAYLRTGFSALDAYLGGMKRSDLIILAARPGIGKTSLVLTMARNAAVAQGAHVAVFSLEMSGEQLAQRLLSSESGVEQNRLLLLGHLREDEERRVMDAAGRLSALEIYIDDTAGLTIADMRSRARRLAHERGLNMIVVDYLQLMHSGVASGGENRVQEISYITRSLKQIARELNVPVIACAQLSRAVESRTPHIPMLSDLRESGSIEQDADVVMFIYREDAYMQKDDWQDSHPDMPGRSYPNGITTIIIAKHRNGPTGQVDLRFHNRTTKFADLQVSD
ncbi:MAG: replicative DNA helicase [Dehalococcoidia bacterium]